MSNLESLARRLVRSRIKGFRKGTSDERQHLHSFRVAGLLRRHGYPPPIVLAGLLHDIVEDGNTTLDELLLWGFSPRTIRLVDLASHDAHDRSKNRRWARMVERLRRAGDKDAWALKMCDLVDNLDGCATLPDAGRRRFFLEVKAPVFLWLTYPVMGQTTLYKALVDACTRPALARYRRILKPPRQRPR